MFGKYSKEIKVGVIVILAIAGAIWGINYLKGRDLFSNSNTYYVVYSQINGLANSNTVTINGYKVGQVDKISFLPDNSGRILIALNINSSAFVSKDATAIIASADLLGTKVVQLQLGESKIAAVDDDTLAGDLEIGMMAQIEPVQQKMETLMISVDSLVNNLNTALSVQNRVNIDQSFSSLSATLKHLDRISYTLDEMTTTENGKIKTTLISVNSMVSNLASNNEKINKIINNMASLSDSLAAANLKSAIDNLNKNMTDFALMLNKVNNGEGSLGKLMNDDKLYTNLNRSSAHLDSLLIDFKENPKRYVHFSVFGKK